MTSLWALSTTLLCTWIFLNVKIDRFGRQVFSEGDVVDMYLKGHDLGAIKYMQVDHSVDLEAAAMILENVPTFVRYNEKSSVSVAEFDQQCQHNWYMPQDYKDLDIAEHVLSMCESDVELQRCGQELMLFQERDLFDLLRYLKYLVDLMTQHRLIWGVGRGSSVASFVLYKLGVHRINSLHYELDPTEFLR
jgi:DNA polymerase III alpha subunit